MVVLGQWPYQHTLTLEKFNTEQIGVMLFYFVDEDQIVSKDQCNELEDEGYVVDHEMYTIMSEELNVYVSAYKEQLFPPSVPEHLASLIDENTSKKFKKSIKDLQDSSVVLVVNGQSSEVMKDIGAEWNQYLGTWIVSKEHMQQLRQKRREDTKGKVYYEVYADAYLKVWGDLSQHIKLLRDIGATHKEDENVWIVKMSSVDKIAHIL